MKILINRTDAIGDTILTLPICEVLKNIYPNSQITYMTSSRCQGVTERIGSVDETWVVDFSENIVKNILFFIKKIFHLSPDIYIHAGGAGWPSFICCILGVKKRIGLKSKWHSFLTLNGGVRQKRTESGKHEVELNLELLSALESEGINKFFISNDKKKSLLKPKVQRENIDHNYAKNILQTNGIKLPLIFIHPGMTGHTLNWKSESYAKLIELIEAKHPKKFHFIVSYTPSDAKYVDIVRDQLLKSNLSNVTFLDGSKDGLAHYIDILSYGSLFIGPSTGTTHLANILELPILCFYSPIKAQCSNRWRPYFQNTDKLEVFEPSVECMESLKCAGESCKYYFCMESMTIVQAYEKIQRFLVC